MVAEYAQTRKRQADKISVTTASNVEPFVITPLFLTDDTSLSPSAYRLYAILRSYVYKESRAYCWPSRRTLAERMGLSVRQIVNLLHELERHETITIERRSVEGRTSIYHLHPANRRGGGEMNCTGGVKPIAPKEDQREEDQTKKEHTQKGANAPVCVEIKDTYPTMTVDLIESGSSAEARDSKDDSQVVYVARPTRQTRGRSAHRRGRAAAPAMPNQQENSTQNVLLTESKVSEAATNRKVTAPAARPTMLERSQPAEQSQTSQHTHAATAAPLTPSEHVQDAIQSEIARQLTEYGVWPKRAAQLAAHACASGRTPDDIRAMHQQTTKANDPAALLATMIVNNAAPPSPSEAEQWRTKYTTGKYAHIFNRQPSADETGAPHVRPLAD